MTECAEIERLRAALRRIVEYPGSVDIVFPSDMEYFHYIANERARIAREALLIGPEEPLQSQGPVMEQREEPMSNPDLLERVQQFNTLQLPGQPIGMHMGTSYLVNDLWREIKRLRAENAMLAMGLRAIIDDMTGMELSKARAARTALGRNELTSKDICQESTEIERLRTALTTARTWLSAARGSIDDDSECADFDAAMDGINRALEQKVDDAKT